MEQCKLTYLFSHQLYYFSDVDPGLCSAMTTSTFSNMNQTKGSLRNQNPTLRLLSCYALRRLRQPYCSLQSTRANTDDAFSTALYVAFISEQLRYLEQHALHFPRFPEHFQLSYKVKYHVSSDWQRNMYDIMTGTKYFNGVFVIVGYGVLSKSGYLHCIFDPWRWHQ